MTLRVYEAYKTLAEVHGWRRTWKGLRAFAKQVDDGLRLAPTYEWRNF